MTWRVLPAPEVELSPRWAVTVVAAGGGIAVLGGALKGSPGNWDIANVPASDGLFFSVEREEWTLLPPRPGPPGPMWAVDTDAGLFTAPYRSKAEPDADAPAWFLDVRTQEWTSVPSPPDTHPSGRPFFDAARRRVVLPAARRRRVFDLGSGAWSDWPGENNPRSVPPQLVGGSHLVSIGTTAPGDANNALLLVSLDGSDAEWIDASEPPVWLGRRWCVHNDDLVIAGGSPPPHDTSGRWKREVWSCSVLGDRVWRRLPDLPFSSDHPALLASTGSELLALREERAFALRGDRWQASPSPVRFNIEGQHVMDRLGDRLYACSTAYHATRLAIWEPDDAMAPAADSDLAAKLQDGSNRFVFRGAPSQQTARRALEAVRRSLEQIRHPEEPTDAFANWISTVSDGPDGPEFTADLKDLHVYPDVIDQIITSTHEALTELASTTDLTPGHLDLL